MDIKKLSAIEIREKVLAKELSAEEIVKVFIKQMEEHEKYNAVLEEPAGTVISPLLPVRVIS